MCLLRGCVPTHLPTCCPCDSFLLPRRLPAVCGLPFEYCEWGPQFPKCKEWFQANFQRFYPEIGTADVGHSDVVTLMTRLGFEGEPDAAAKKAQSSKKKPSVEAEAGAEGAEAPADGTAAAPAGGGKKKKQDSKSVVIELTTRNKKKHVTAVRGLEGFGVDVPAAAKLFGKKVRRRRHLPPAPSFTSCRHRHPSPCHVPRRRLHARALRACCVAVRVWLGLPEGQERAARPDRDTG